MITDITYQHLINAINNASDYTSGIKRKQLQATYDKLLDEISIKIFNEPCTSRIILRQKLNEKSVDSDIIIKLKDMLKNDELLFRKDYRDHSDEIVKFLNNHVHHFLRALRND